MEKWVSNLQVVFALRFLSASFLAVLFLQSGLDKVFHRRNNLKWLTAHFANSPLAAHVPTLLFLITLMEVAAGTLSGMGMVVWAVTGLRSVAIMGAAFSGLSLLSLFFGQRMAKDYAGAASLVPYFLLSLSTLVIWS